MKKRITKLLIMVMIMSAFMSIPAMAAIDYPSGVSIERLEIYPANVDTEDIYRGGYYINFGPTVNQWQNATLGTKMTDFYNSKNSNGFYIKLTVVNAHQAIRYEAYDGNQVVKKGLCTSIPNNKQVIDFFVKTSGMTALSDGFYEYASWKTVFYGYTNSKPLYGTIYIPVN